MARAGRIGPAVRHAWLARLYGNAMAWYLRLVAATARLEGRVTRDHVVIVFWHEFNLAVVVAALKGRGDLLHASFSTRGFRGVVITTLLERLKLQVLPLPDEGIARAEARDFTLRLARLAADGYSPVMTPDGPFGPYRVAKPGALIVARAAGLPLQPWAIDVRPRLRLRSRWDRQIVPLPFSRIRVKAGSPIVMDARQPIRGLVATLEAELNRLSGPIDRR